MTDVSPPASPIISSPAAWNDLSEEERTALKRMNRGPYPALTEAMGQRLIGLGLAVLRPDGVGISRIGREMVIDTLLTAGRKEKGDRACLPKVERFRDKDIHQNKGLKRRKRN